MKGHSDETQEARGRVENYLYTVQEGNQNRLL